MEKREKGHRTSCRRYYSHILFVRYALWCKMTVFVSCSMHAWVKACCAWGEESVSLVQHLVCCVCYVYSVFSIYISMCFCTDSTREQKKTRKVRKESGGKYNTRPEERELVRIQSAEKCAILGAFQVFSSFVVVWM